MPERAVERDLYHALVTFGDTVVVDIGTKELTTQPREGLLVDILDTEIKLPLDELTPEFVRGMLDSIQVVIPDQSRILDLWVVEDGLAISKLYYLLPDLGVAAVLYRKGQTGTILIDCANHRAYRWRTGRLP